MMSPHASDAARERRAFLPTHSRAEDDMRGSLGLQTRPRRAPTAFRSVRTARLPRAIAAVTVVGAVLTVLLFFTSQWPLSSTEDVERQRLEEQKALEAADASTPRRLSRFEVSKLTLNNLDVVDVTFEYAAPQPAFFGRDRVGAYCVSAANERANCTPSVLEFMDTVHTEGQAQGSVRVGPLVNMRCSWLLRFITGDDVVLAESPLLRFARGPTQPLQVHLALTDKPDEMRVQWTSDQVEKPVVLFGLQNETLSSMESASHSSYAAADMCRAPATIEFPRNFRDPGQLYDAVMTRLLPGQPYFYRVGDADGELSDVFEFQLPPPVGINAFDLAENGEEEGKDDPTMSFFVFGDLNSPVKATQQFAVEGSCGTTMQLIREDMERAAADLEKKHKYVAVLHVGDLAYAMGATYIWDQFGQLIEYVAARLPYMVSIGNHDYGYLEGVEKNPEKFPRHPTFEKDETHGLDSYGECGIPTEKRFHMPENGNGVYWYSFDTGLAHHTVLSSEHEFARGSEMHQWLLNDLKAVNRDKTPWLFVHLHRPLYCSVAFSGDYYRSLLFRDELEQVLADYHVDVVFSGHYHSYERTCPVFGDRCYTSPEGKALAPVHLMIGSGGANKDDYGYYRAEWHEQGFMEYGYGRVHIYNKSHLHFEFVSNAQRSVKDDTWIISTHDWRSRRERFPPGYFPTQDLVGLAAAVFLAVLVSAAVIAPAIRRAMGSSTNVSLSAQFFS